MWKLQFLISCWNLCTWMQAWCRTLFSTPFSSSFSFLYFGHIGSVGFHEPCHVKSVATYEHNVVHFWRWITSKAMTSQQVGVEITRRHHQLYFLFACLYQAPSHVRGGEFGIVKEWFANTEKIILLCALPFKEYPHIFLQSLVLNVKGLCLANGQAGWETPEVSLVLKWAVAGVITVRS